VSSVPIIAPAHRRAFTLVELLIVIAILVVLVAMLIPGLYRAIEEARFIVCLNNVRQLSTASFLFTSENKGRMPGPNWGGYPQSTAPRQVGWLYASNQMHTIEGLKTGQLWPYLNNYKVYRCPLDRPSGDPSSPDSRPAGGWPNTRTLTSYTANGSLCGYGGSPFDSATGQWQQRQLSEYSANDILYWEQREFVDDGQGSLPNYGDWWDGANSPDQGVTGRHRKRCAVGCMDGHVEKMPTDRYYELVGSARPNRLWNPSLTK
jgi:prepilin-type N-terminal cleavage/methylation domain-containing protein